MKHLKIISSLVALVGGLISTSQASIVLPVGTPAAPIGAPDLLDPAAGLIQGPLASPFASVPAGPFTGILTSTVIQENAIFNPLGGYTFVYDLVNNATSPDAMGRLTINDWKNALPFVFAGNSVTGATPASSADRAAINAGDVIGFNWDAGLAPGGSAEVFIRTSLQYWTYANGSVIDGATASPIQTYAVPEPTTLVAGALLLLPFGASTLRILRKNRSA